MLAVRSNTHKYEYDIHSLVKAFYPTSDVKVFVEGEKDLKSDSGEIALFVILAEDKGQVQMLLSAPDGTRKKMDQDDISYPDKEGLSFRNRIKCLLYQMLAAYTGRSLPWGSLTGVRPTRIPMNLIGQGQTDEEIRRHMEDLYFVSKEKADLALSIAHLEQEILDQFDYEKGYSLYIGIPFCPTTCMYCSFPSYPLAAYRDQTDRYLSCLDREIDYVREAFSDKKLQTIYIGGGTPTTLTPDQMDHLLGRLEERLDLSNLKELTVESGRPDSMDRDKLRAMKRHKVTRISVNPQTMQDKTLQRIGRHHSVQQTLDAYQMAREEGFDDINMDIILGLPGETTKDLAHTLSVIQDLKPDDLTVHSLAIKRGSKLHEMLLGKEEADLHGSEDMMDMAADTARQLGLFPYYLYRQKNMTGNMENTGFAAPGKYGLYNILMMEEKQSIVALGAGTITKAVSPDGRIERCDAVRDLMLYMDKIDEMIDRKRKLFEKI